MGKIIPEDTLGTESLAIAPDKGIESDRLLASSNQVEYAMILTKVSSEGLEGAITLNSD